MSDENMNSDELQAKLRAIADCVSVRVKAARENTLVLAGCWLRETFGDQARQLEELCNEVRAQSALGLQ